MEDVLGRFGRMPVNLGLGFGFLLLSMLLSAIPGPSVLLETSRAITQGRRSAMWIVLGNALGGLVLLGLVLAGLGAIVAASAKLFTVIKVAGACYLLWLGAQSIRSAWLSTPAPIRRLPAYESPGRINGIRRGFLVGAMNPKSIVSLMAILPQFVDHQLPHPTIQMLVIGLAGGIAQVVIETIWVAAAGSLRNWFQRRPHRVRYLKTAGGVAMIGLAGKLAAERS